MIERLCSAEIFDGSPGSFVCPDLLRVIAAPWPAAAGSGRQILLTVTIEPLNLAEIC
jgi:hypothetical protein